MTNHMMTTRSKTKNEPIEEEIYNSENDSETSRKSIESIDSNGNIRDLIDDSEVNTHETAKALMELRQMTRPSQSNNESKEKKKNQKKDQKKKDQKKKDQKNQRKISKRKEKREMGMNDMLMSLLVLKATEKANEELQKRKKEKRHSRKKRKSKKPVKKGKPSIKDLMKKEEVEVAEGVCVKEELEDVDVVEVVVGGKIKSRKKKQENLNSADNAISYVTNWATQERYPVYTPEKDMIASIMADKIEESDSDSDIPLTDDEEESDKYTDENKITVTIQNAEFIDESQDEIYETESEEEQEDWFDEEYETTEESFDSRDYAESESEEESGSEEELGSEEEESEEESGNESEETLFEYDDLDMEYEEMLEKRANINTEESDMIYYHKLTSDKKKELFKQTNDIYDYSSSAIPLRFKVIQSDMDIKTKSIAMDNLDKLREMDVSTGEHSKMDHWIQGLMKIPFGKYKSLSIKPSDAIADKRQFIQNAYKTLNQAIYGHKEAKTHILQVLGKWMKNPESGGNVLAIQGPMGNGKTTLVKEGISKVLDRPFAFIALGGASDSAYFDGHCYTYEGSHWGRIVQILQDSQCMNPVFYFDELDKISDTQKGEEIIHMLTHITDSSQNSLFQDNYFPGINLDLSKALFIFSYNDESRVNKILKDRMYVIHTKGFSVDDKLKIAREYLIPDIYENYGFVKDDISFSDEILKNIVENYTDGEEGVRNLKRCLETIISKINIYMLAYDKNDEESVKDLSFKIKDFEMPLQVIRDHTEALLINNKISKAPMHMYI